MAASDMNKVLKVRVDKMDEVLASLDALTTNRVLIGIPATTAGREEDPIVNNAMIGYINEFGSPAQNIPPRPHLQPGVRAATPRIISRLRSALVAAMDAKRESAIKQLHAVGMICASSVKSKIRSGPFIPLSDRTLRARVNRNTTKGRAGSRKGAAKELANRAAGMAPSSALAKPLIDTSAYLRSITYVIRGGWFRG